MLNIVFRKPTSVAGCKCFQGLASRQIMTRGVIARTHFFTIPPMEWILTGLIEELSNVSKFTGFNDSNEID